MQYFLILSLIFSIIFPYLNSLSFLSRLTNTLNNFDMHFVCGYVLYYVAGYYLTTISWKKVYSYAAIVIFIISYGAAYISSVNISIANGAPYQQTFTELTPLAFPAAISVFCIFKDFEIQLPSKLVKPLIGYGFGIYLMHPLFLRYVQQISGFAVYLGVIGLYLTCILICFMISRNKFLSKLFLR